MVKVRLFLYSYNAALLHIILYTSILSGQQYCESFVIKIQSSPKLKHAEIMRTEQRRYEKVRKDVSTTSLSAQIFTWDDSDDGDTLTHYSIEDIYSPSPSSFCQSSILDCNSSPVGRVIAENLSRNSDNLGALARLAVAYSPEERCLDIKDIHHVEVLNIDGHHIEISAVVCEVDGCVTLFVPVTFSHDCPPDTLEECVLENINELDNNFKAQCAIRGKDLILRSNADVPSDEDNEELCALYSNEGITYPDWWVPPAQNHEMVVECETIRKLLNDPQFQKELKILAQYRLQFMDDGHLFDLHRVSVTAISPAGFYLRAQVRRRDSNNKTLTIIDLPLSFGAGKVFEDAPSLRAAVVGAVAFAAGDLTP